MGSHRKVIAMRIMKFVHSIVTIAFFVVLYVSQYNSNQLSYSGLFSLALYATLIIWLFRTYKAQAVGMYRIWELVYSQFLSNGISAVFLYAVVCITWERPINPVPFLFMIVMQFLFNTLWSFLANKLFFSFYAPKKTLVVYEKKSELEIIEEIPFFKQKFSVKKWIQIPKSIDLLFDELSEYEVLFVLVGGSLLREKITLHCMQKGIQIYTVPRVEDIVLIGAKHFQVFNMPTMRICRSEPRIEYLLFKRLFDIVFAFSAIVALSPIIAIISLSVKIYDRGPVLYKQSRLTKDGKLFTIFKFRSMRTDAEQDGIARLALEEDDRITPVGKVIRAIRLDELPQLLNIIKGDMSIVGPRPERPEIAAQYEKDIPEFSLRLQVKAGLTGFAQVYGRYNTDPYHKLKMDLMYMNNMSLMEDLKLIFATVKILFLPESTKGIASGSTTAIDENLYKKYECNHTNDA